jgi:ubiquitin-like 1-activating enzyme E1 A
MYRALLEYQNQTKQWLGFAERNNPLTENKNKELMNVFFKSQGVTKEMMTDADVNELVTSGMSQVAPVCAVLGGIVGNEVIKVISGKGEPANNTLLFDGGSCKAWTFLVKAKE